MTYLLLSVVTLCMVVQNAVAKQYNKQSHTNPYIYSAIVAAVAMLFFFVSTGGKFDFNGEFVIYSIAFGISYLCAMIGNVVAIGCGPLSLSVLINQLSLIFPTLYGIILLGEKLKFVGYVGILLVFVCLFLVNSGGRKNGKISLKWIVWVSIGCLGNGMCSVTQKIQQNAFSGGYKNEFMIVALLIASVVMYIIGVKTCNSLKKDTAEAVKYAPISGVANATVNLLVMILMATLPTAVLYPVTMAGGIVLTFILSVTVYRERLTVLQYIGYAIGVLAIVFINL